MSRVVVITGMHRSGTSLVASLVREAGVDIGDRFLDPTHNNPRGFFEDADFLEFHRRILKDRRRTILVNGSFGFEPQQEELNSAERLVAARTDRTLWGWKDPRTALFLDFWDARLDRAVYLFVFRHPLDVVLSLVRRASDYEALGLTEPVRAWEAYNRRILAFYARNPDRCALIHADRLPRLEQLNGALQRLGLNIEVTPAALARLYRADELHATDYWAKGCFAVLEPGAAGLYHELARAAGAVPSEPPSSDEPEELRTFRTLAGELRPHAGPRHRGLLLTLLELVSPDTVESGIERQFEGMLELTEAKEWLDEQRLSWMRIAENLESRRFRSRVGRRLDRIRRMSH